MIGEADDMTCFPLASQSPPKASQLCSHCTAHPGTTEICLWLVCPLWPRLLSPWLLGCDPHRARKLSPPPTAQPLLQLPYRGQNPSIRSLGRTQGASYLLLSKSENSGPLNAQNDAGGQCSLCDCPCRAGWVGCTWRL